MMMGTKRFRFIESRFLCGLNSGCPALHRCTSVRVELWLSVLLEINGKALAILNFNGAHPCVCVCVCVYVCSCVPPRPCDV